MSDLIEYKNTNSEIQQNKSGFLLEIYIKPLQILIVLGAIADMITIIVWLNSGSYWANVAGIVAITIFIILILLAILLYIEYRSKQNQIPTSIILEGFEQIPQRRTKFLKPVKGKKVENSISSSTLKNLRIYVFDNETEEPIGNAQCVARGEEEGQIYPYNVSGFVTARLQSGYYSITASAKGYESNSEAVEVVEDSNSVSIGLKKAD